MNILSLLQWRKRVATPFCVIALSIILITPITSFAKKPQGVEIDPDLLFDDQVLVGQSAVAVKCNDKVAGKLKNNGRFVTYKSLKRHFKKQSKKLKKRASKNTSKSNKFLKKSKRALKKSKRNAKLAKANCNLPEQFSLQPYTGAFTAKEARLLYDRFAIGATPTEINQAVTAGLDATVTRLTTYVTEPAGYDAYIRDLECDGIAPGDPDYAEENETCDPLNPNDFEVKYFRYGMYYRFKETNNPFFLKLMMFIHDERMAASSECVGGSERYAIKRHFDNIMKAAKSGDYIQLGRDYNNGEYLVNIKCLDGGSNKAGNALFLTPESPNENYAREFWELYSIGQQTDPSGNTIYTDLDLSQAALAHSGWTIIKDSFTDSEGNDQDIYLSSYSPDRHFFGSKTVFRDTQHETVVEDAEDLLIATMAHPRASEHLAEDIWQEYIGETPPPLATKKLAAVIRDNNFNLLPIMRAVMKSKAFFNTENKDALLKHPFELLFGFIRATDFPMTYNNMDQYLEQLGQRPFLSPTIFGWDMFELASSAYITPRRNQVLRFIMDQDSDDLEEDFGYDLFGAFLANLPSGVDDSAATVDRVAAILGIELTSDQRETAIFNLDYNLDENCSQSEFINEECDEVGQPFYEREAYDANRDAEDWDVKLRFLIGLLIMLPEYAVK